LPDLSAIQLLLDTWIGSYCILEQPKRAFIGEMRTRKPNPRGWLPTVCRTQGSEIAWWTFACLLLASAACAIARAQLPFDLPKTAPQDGASLFVNQCGTCHVVQPGAQPRQGPNLAGVYMRRAGTLDGFHYSAGFARATFVWDDTHLDAWLSSPQRLILGAVMLYRQDDPAIRLTIIAWLKEQH
jgi:cytochrome c